MPVPRVLQGAIRWNFAGWIPDNVTIVNDTNAEQVTASDQAVRETIKKNVDPVKDVIPIWVHPSSEDMDTLSNNNTAIFNYTDNQLAKWVQKGGIDSEWSDYLKKVIVSSSPQVRYPDYYGIDMSSMDQFIAFKAALALLEERGMGSIVRQVYEKIKAANGCTDENYVKEIYAPFSDEEISAKIAELLTPEGITTPVTLIFQTVEGLHRSCPNHPGDWYFTGDYPTPGGLRMLNRAFMAYVEEEMNL